MRSPLFSQMNGCALKHLCAPASLWYLFCEDKPSYPISFVHQVILCCVSSTELDELGLHLKLWLLDPTVDVVLGTSINVDWVFDCFKQDLSPFLVSFSNPLTISGRVVLGFTAHW